MASTVSARPVPPFPVVGIGASAGGFPALAALLGRMPPCPGMALVVVLHLAAHRRSGIARVLQTTTALPVVEVSHSMPVLPDRVYVAPADRALRIEGELLVLDELQRSAAAPVAIDLFLASLAEGRGTQAVGVLLSGAGAGGAEGWRASAQQAARSSCSRRTRPGRTACRARPSQPAWPTSCWRPTRSRPSWPNCALRTIRGAVPRPPSLPRQGRRENGAAACSRSPTSTCTRPPPWPRPASCSTPTARCCTCPRGRCPSCVRPPGEPSCELAALVLPGLRPALRAALFQAQRTGLPATTDPLADALSEGQAHALDIHVLPFRDDEAGADLMLVSFHRLPDPPPAAHDSALLRALETEVLQLRATLSRTADQAEAHISNLVACGEELLTTIDELHAGADELERRNDELLAANGSLEAERERLRRELADAAQAHDDLTNLVASSDVATLFLDRDMRIVRYTPRIATLFDVTPADVGRPLAHLASRLDRPCLADEAAAVFETLQAMECEVRGMDGRDHIVRVHPYRAGDNRIAGAVMSFFDISSRRAAESALRTSEARLSTIFASMPTGAGVVGCDGVLVMGNDELRRYLPTGRMPSRDADRLQRWRAWDADGRPLGREDFPGARALRGERVAPGIEMLYTHDDGSMTWAQVASSPLRDETGAIVGQVAVVTDIDTLKRSEAALRENEARLRGLVGGLAQAVWEAAPDGLVVLDSPSWRAYTGQALEEWIGDGCTFWPPWKAIESSSSPTMPPIRSTFASALAAMARMRAGSSVIRISSSAIEVACSGPRRSWVSAAVKRSRRPRCTRVKAFTASLMAASIDPSMTSTSAWLSETPSRCRASRMQRRKIWYSSIRATWS